jgi:TIR domain
MKVFISFSTKDRQAAAALFRDLQKGGASAFQFGRSETAGQPSWDQIIEWINACDAFVVLVSSNALKSTAVAEEITMAYGCYINSERKKPAKIIPAIIESGAAPPPLIRHMSELDLVDYQAGLPKLLRQLGLKVIAPAPMSAAPALPAIDFDRLAREHIAANPPTATAALLGRSPQREPLHTLTAPKLRADGNTLRWTSVFGAREYVVERRAQLGNTQVNDEVYRGTDLSYPVPSGSSSMTFRVKATGVVFKDSPWSDSVHVAEWMHGLGLLAKRGADTPRPPKPTRLPGPFFCEVRWLPVIGATSYVLERGREPGQILAGGMWETVYEGPKTEFRDHENSSLMEGGPPTYRVKAIGPWGETAWG